MKNEIGKKTESVRVDIATIKLLKKIKEEEGINMTSAITLAVKEKYGNRLHIENK